jgi:Domain of Unknown Function (DUF1080)
MPRLRLPTAILCLFSAGCATTHAGRWTDLLDRNLSRFDVYLSFPGAVMNSVLANTAPPTLKPIGLNKDVDRVFSVIEASGRPVLRISGEIYGAAVTKQEFDNFDFVAKVKWGIKKWPPRLNLERDSGVLYFSIGEYGVDYWHSWMLSQEFQIAEHHMGDYWSIAGSQIDIRSRVPPGDKAHIYARDAQPVAYDRELNYCRAAEDPEIAQAWNEIELICFQNRCVQIVNGRVVMALSNSRYSSGSERVPLSRGRIQIQSEAAEVYYKDMRIRSITSMPSQYANYF